MKSPIIILYFLPCLLYANLVKINDTKEDNFLIGTILEVMEDTSGKLTIDDVSSPQYSKAFRPNLKRGKSAPYIEKPGVVYWIRFTVQCESKSTKRWVLENIDPHIDEFEFYVPEEEKGYIKYKAGYSLPFHVRPFEHKNFIFDLPINEEPQTFYARAVSENHNPFFFKIRSYNYFTFYSLAEYYALGIFYGILLIMAIYNLLVYFSIRDKVYLYYVAYVLCSILISLAEDGTGFQYLWPTSPTTNKVISKLSPLLLLVSFTIYSKKFLEIRQYLPMMNNILNYFTYTYSVFFILDVTWLRLKWDFPLYIFPFTAIYISAIICLKKGLKQARYYLLGYSFMFISIIFLIFRMSGIIHWSDIFTVYSFNIGLVFEILILSFALSDRIKIIRLEKELAQQKIIEQLQENEKLKDKVNRELEQKVKERTLEIEQKNAQLAQMNLELKIQAEEINRMNLLLDADNRKLQNNVKDLVKARVMVQHVDFEEFKKIFPNADSCYKFLHDLKWDNGYSCKRCHHNRWCQGKDKYSKRCTRCRYDESATSYTIFHRLKFDIQKAFYMVFLVYANKGKITSQELSEILSLRQSTCWAFSKKVQEAMKEKRKQGQENEGWASLIMDMKNA